MERCARSLPFLVAGVTSVTAGRTARHTLQDQTRLADDDARTDVVLQNVTLQGGAKKIETKKQRRIVLTRLNSSGALKGVFFNTTKALWKGRRSPRPYEVQDYREKKKVIKIWENDTG